jgi:hypothetical protein
LFGTAFGGKGTVILGIGIVGVKNGLNVIEGGRELCTAVLG